MDRNRSLTDCNLSISYIAIYFHFPLKQQQEITTKCKENNKKRLKIVAKKFSLPKYFM